jgi:hypothetical protein
MWGKTDITRDYSNHTNLGEVFATIKNAVNFPHTAKCETETGKISAGARMPKANKERKKPLRSAPKLSQVPTYDLIGGQINMISNQMMMMSDGFDFNLTNIVADNSNMNMGIQGDSVFNLRHQMSFEGPWAFLMTGGQITRDYSVEIVAQKGKDYTMVANWTPSQGTMDGQWAYRWNKNISSEFTFAVTSSNDRRLAMMLPNYSGKVSWANTMHNFTAGKGQAGTFFISTLHRVLPRLLVGSKMIVTDAGDSFISGGFQYKIPGLKPQEQEVLELRASAKQITAMYTRSLSKHATLAAKCDFNVRKKASTASVYYKYMFGSENSGSQIYGEITSKACCKVIWMMPFLQRFMLRCTGELNHLDYNHKMGQVPHKFGFTMMTSL